MGKKFVEVVYKFIFKCPESPVILGFHIVSKPVTLFGNLLLLASAIYFGILEKMKLRKTLKQEHPRQCKIIGGSFDFIGLVTYIRNKK